MFLKVGFFTLANLSFGTYIYILLENKNLKFFVEKNIRTNRISTIYKTIWNFRAFLRKKNRLKKSAGISNCPKKSFRTKLFWYFFPFRSQRNKNKNHQKSRYEKNAKNQGIKKSKKYKKSKNQKIKESKNQKRKKEKKRKKKKKDSVPKVVTAAFLQVLMLRHCLSTSGTAALCRHSAAAVLLTTILHM